MEEIKDIFADLMDLGLVTEDLSEDPDLIEWMQSDQKELINFWTITEDNEKTITADTLVKMPFNQALDTVKVLSMKNRLDVLSEISKLRLHYYDFLGIYGAEGVPKEEQISPEDFRSILGKIKHLEIIQNWLYGIM